MLNYITIHGRLTADPEFKQTQSGVSICKLTVAVDRSHKSGEETQTDFFNVVCWRGLADMVSKYFHKGKEIIVSGEMQSEKWKDKEGNNRISWTLNATTIDFCGKRNQNENSQNNETTNAPTVNLGSDFEDVGDVGEVPF